MQRRYSRMSNEQLEILVRHFRVERPDSGMRYVIGRLRSHGIRIQKERVRLTLVRVDALGQALRICAVMDKRTYQVRRPDALWHMDGHHKMIRWGIVVHGIVDGFTRRASVPYIFSVVLEG